MPFIVMFFGVIAAAIAFFTNKEKAKRDARWQEAARELGLRAETSTWGYPKIHGTIGPLEVSVSVKKTGGNNNSVRTRYRIRYPDLGFGLRMRPENFVTKLGTFFGGQDLEVGDEHFDSSFIIKARDAAAMREFMTRERQLVLLRLAAAYPPVEVNDDGIELEAYGASQAASTIVSIVRRLVSAARQLTEDSAWDDAVALQAAGDAGAAAERLRARVRPHPDDVDTPLFEAAVFHAVGDDDAARTIIEDVSTRMPDDPEVAGWRSRLRERESAPQQRMDPPPPPPDPVVQVERSEHVEQAGEETASVPASATTWDSDALAIAQELFGSRRMSFETDGIFEKAYAGRPIRWRGKVKRVKPYERDLDFGEEPGTKVVVTVASIENDLYGQTTIDAVVQLEAGAAERVGRGADIAFTGTLHRLDSLMRNIYVRDGKLI